MTLPIVYEDDNLFVINKPAGIAVHKASPTDPQETVADILVRERPYLASVGESPLRPGLVHRLDKETSGIMLIAKNQSAFLFLKEQFQSRLVKKEYLALVYGHPKEPKGTIAAPLGKIGAKQTTQLKGRRELVERDAVTDYATEKSFRDYTLLRVMPQTGRTHQIRVHLKSIGCPIVGDALYATGKTKPPGLDRMFLHATTLSFTAPDGKALTLEVELPESLQKALDTLE
ncbi:MAG: RluA family pseudouridine synthase [Patescibacteria group bacterium]